MEKISNIEKLENQTPQVQARKHFMNLVWGVVFIANILIILSLLFDYGGLLWYILVW